MSIESIIGRLIELLDKKAVLMERLYWMTLEQKSFLKTESIDSFMNEMKKRQLAMDEIDQIDSEFYRLYIEVKEMMGIASLEYADTKKYPQLASLHQKVQAVMEITQKIQELDEQNKGEVSEKFEQVKEDMKKLQAQKSAASKISKGYASKYNHAQGVFIDNKK